MNKKYLELTKLIRSKQNDHEILKCLSNYHENDIADMLTVMTPKERKRIYTLLGPQKIAEIFAYLDEPQIYFSELSVKDAAKVVSLMDSDDAVDVLETLDDKKKYEIVENLDKAAIKDVKMLLSYDDDEIGSCMTTNYICIPKGLSVRQAMSELVRQAGTNDNISTIYVLDEPTTGLHFADVHKLVEILRKLSDGGNTVVVIEHNLDVIKTADYIIDMGPEGGDKGGTVIAKGTPEEVAESPVSYTGKYIKPMLEK